MKFLIPSLTALIVISLLVFAVPAERKKQHTIRVATTKVTSNKTALTEKKFREKAAAAKMFTHQKSYNEQVCILIDMELPSGANRLRVYDLQKDSVVKEGLVTHGNCFQSWLEGRKYSNKVGSGCTSIGKYKIGSPYVGKFGYSYKLHGLDSTNNNALERTVVLHAHSCVPDEPVSEEICQSNGCTTVSPNMLVYLKGIINNSRKPILLWVYE